MAKLSTINQHRIISALVLFMAGLYVLVPLHQPLLDGFHKLEHSILNTSSAHSHEHHHHHELAYDHQHKWFSFLNDLFQENNTKDNTLKKEFKLDKHTVRAFKNIEVFAFTLSGATFFYQNSNYAVDLALSLPPPEVRTTFFV